MSLSSQKHLFSLDENVHYLNCAYRAPLLKSAEKAALNALEISKNPFKYTANSFFDELGEVKTLFSKIAKCNPKEVAIIPSASYGFACVLNNVSNKENGHAIVVGKEFPSGYFAARKWCDVHNADLKIIDANDELNLVGEDWNNRILGSINEHTAVLLMSSIHWMNGLKFDLKAIGEKCKSVGAKFIVDGTQSVGALPIDVKALNIDALICAAYKWLMGPYSMGLAYFGEAFHNGNPIEESWMNRTNCKDFSNLTNYGTEYTEMAGRYNVGQTSNFLLMPLLKAALTQLNAWEIENIEAYCKELIQPLKNYLGEVGVELEKPEHFCNHLFGLQLPAGTNPEILDKKLAEKNISVSKRGSTIRVSVNVYNTKADITALIKALKESN